jgi:hypothetical protein
MEVFFIALAGDLEPCIVDKEPHNYEMTLKMTYSDIHLSITKKVPIQDQKNESIEDQPVTSFDFLEEDDLLCFEEIFRQKTNVRDSEFQVGVHRITYFYSESLVAMPDYIYDPPVPSFPLLIGVDIESILKVF